MDREQRPRTPELLPRTKRHGRQNALATPSRKLIAGSDLGMSSVRKEATSWRATGRKVGFKSTKLFLWDGFRVKKLNRRTLATLGMLS